MVAEFFCGPNISRFCWNYFFFGRKATQCCGSVSSRGPSSRSMQYGIAGITASIHSRTARGCPGRLMISDRPQIPAVCRLRIAVGTTCSDTARISSPNPGSIFWHTASVASGVTSRSAGPVPPVVTIRAHCCWLPTPRKATPAKPGN